MEWDGGGLGKRREELSSSFCPPHRIVSPDDSPVCLDCVHPVSHKPGSDALYLFVSGATRVAFPDSSIGRAQQLAILVVVSRVSDGGLALQLPSGFHCNASYSWMKSVPHSSLVALGLPTMCLLQT